MTILIKRILLIASVLVVSSPVSAAMCDAHAKDAKSRDQHEHHARVDARGDHVMTFSHQKSRHSFVLLQDGGAIEVRALDGADSQTTTKIRTHLQEIAKLFATGDFAKPIAIHGRLPDGADTMKRARNQIRYTFEQIEGGGRVRIRSSEKAAVEAIHAFLRFQIKDHRTGDSLEVRK